jgi:N-acetylmuramoyl-L-alanine amidase
MKIGLRAGHSDNVSGAVEIVDEHEQMKKYYTAVKTVFEKYGHTVIDCNSNATTQTAELNEGTSICNNNNCDLFISLHMNCFNGSANGTEVLVSSETSGAYGYALRLVDNFAELGFVNRGVKFEKLYEMNHTNCGNMISEICFCDSQTDIDIYNKYSWEKLAYVLCNAVDGTIPKEPTDIVTKGYVITNYLPGAYNGYDGVDIDYVLSYFNGIKCYVRGNNKGVWIETEYMTLDKCNELKKVLGTWFYNISTI